ncbi:hypothetical protein [Cerasicoccus arenae]|uniref:Uncharacterized protein n=1 Tax=Cerasicoccus arenae TaxID=424488 RepID=A0A8J3GFK6_9BACT|nr:hypothetical protein [Cerasicoccus arenae]MBK1858063.1 hypothetical protein [Cerasicoccus arenae]GHC06839.1 hypothetical protein GCM10007047_24860 [Cerasicoccus arenae]
MKFFRTACLSIHRLILWLWNSPTFTTWGNTAVQSLRLVLITPLILTRFDELEIASWYLFASLNFFGVLITQRLNLTFTRMLAFAMGGATSLAPIEGKRVQKNDGTANWPLFERAFGVIGVMTLVVSLVNVLVAYLMAWFGLGNILQGASDSHGLWIAFGILQATSFFQFTFLNYQIALQGMNHVAIVNRWSVVWGIFSTIAGSIAVYAGGGIIALVIVMQLTALIGTFWNRQMLHLVEGGRARFFRIFRFDQEVFHWSWGPTWKGLLGQFGMVGSVQLSGVLYSAYASKGELASYLFALRMIQTLTQMAQAPFIAVQPLMSRLRSMNDIEALRNIVLKRGGLSLLLLLLGIIAFGVVLSPILELIGSNMQFISRPAWFLLGLLVLVVRFDVFCTLVCAVGNEMVFYWDVAVAALVGLACLFIIQNQLGYYGPILASLLPNILILNWRPYRKAAHILW